MLAAQGYRGQDLRPPRWMTPEQAVGVIQAPPGGSRHVTCSLCPVMGGAFRQTLDGAEWVHQVQALPDITTHKPSIY